MGRMLHRWRPGWQLRLRWVCVTRTDHTIVWLSIGGRKPLAHLPTWRRRLLHLPSVRWRLWPRPWNRNGPMRGWRHGYGTVKAQRDALWDVVHAALQDAPEAHRVRWLDEAERVFRSAQEEAV